MKPTTPFNADQRIHDVEEAHGEALLDDVYHDWPGEPGLDPNPDDVPCEEQEQ